MMLLNWIFVIISFLSLSHSYKLNGRIINGFDAKRAQFPSYSYLEITEEDDTESFCGGSLISREHILTAAHCIIEAKRVTVNLGSLEADKYYEIGRKAIVVEKDNLIAHPHYYQILSDADIAIIKLPEPVEFSNTIQPIELPTTCDSNINISAIIVGNGDVSIENDAEAKILQWARVTTIPFEKCKKEYEYISKSIICAESVEDRTIGDGDSGGPLIRFSDGRLIGVTSFSHADSPSLKEPQGFTHVISYFNWISQVTGMKLPKCRKNIDDLYFRLLFKFRKWLH